MGPSEHLPPGPFFLNPPLLNTVFSEPVHCETVATFGIRVSDWREAVASVVVVSCRRFTQVSDLLRETN